MAPIDRAHYFVISKKTVRRTAAVGHWAVAVLLTFHPLLLSSIARFLIVDQPPQPADAIVVLGGGSGEREVTGARLYAQGLAGTVFTTGGSVPMPSLQNISFAQLSATELESLGVPAAHIITVPESASTCDDAVLSSGHLPPSSKRVIIVTDPFHTRRAQWLFQEVLPHIQVIAVAANPTWFNPDQWWLEARGWTVVGEEYVKLVLNFVEGCQSRG